MSFIEELTTSTIQWLIQNTTNIIYSTAAAIALYIFYKVSIRELKHLEERGSLDETAAFVLRRLIQWSSALALIAFVIAQFGIKIDLVAGLLVLTGGTVIGFAAMNTLGNAIAGLIIMTSRPFNIGDRLLWNGSFVDVQEINLIYTRMASTDNTVISVPNQTLIQTEIENYGKGNTIRRRYAITVGFEEDIEKVQEALLEASTKVEGILSSPEPYVWLTGFQNFAVQYTLYAYIDAPKNILRIDAAMRAAILEGCRLYDIDISTPSLFRSI